MSKTKLMIIITAMIVFVMAISACATATTVAPVATSAPISTGASPNVPAQTIGMILVGPYNDSGWSQATYEGSQYVLSKFPNLKFNLY